MLTSEFREQEGGQNKYMNRGTGQEQLEALSKVLWGRGGENDFDFMLLEGSWQEEWRVVPFSIGHSALSFVLSQGWKMCSAS